MELKFCKVCQKQIHPLRVKVHVIKDPEVAKQLVELSNIY